ncbi:citron Rho-interacting kinase [Topomyia yanbarensis]|uniref:citron Rho-interacting kinase n=1 Tax=Topomyia yanbarensis TaxID=2498891 RepID=UPI00273B94AE|nr:citron Rho-interacting kinase [Topomyia yanbarensis]
MQKLKKKLKNKFKSSKIECHPDDFSVLSCGFSPDGSPAPPPTAPDQSDSTSSSCSVGRPGPRPPPGSLEDTGNSSNSGHHSPSSNYNCCYNYNFSFNYNFSPPPHQRCTGSHSPPNWRDDEICEELSKFDSNSNLVSESSCELTKKSRKGRKVRPVTTEKSKRSNSSMSSKVTPSNARLMRADGIRAPRCLSTSDLSTYKGSVFSEASQDYQNICSRLNSLKVTEILDQKGANLTDHDRRILHCMVLKRIKEIERLEESVVAKECWEQEKIYRKSLLDEQERNYKNTIRQKRNIEQIEIRNRKQRLERLEKQQIEKIQNEITEKGIRSSSLLKTLEIQKGIKECEKKNRELKRLEDTTVNQEEKTLDKDIWRQSLVDHLEERVQRADELRHRVIEVYKRRVKIDNQLEKKMHSNNLKQTLEQERYKLMKLKERILVRESRFQRFKDSKNRIFDQLKNRAKTTAALRDMVKHSITPDTCPRTIAGNQRAVSVVRVK